MFKNKIIPWCTILLSIFSMVVGCSLPQRDADPTGAQTTLILDSGVSQVGNGVLGDGGPSDIWDGGQEQSLPANDAGTTNEIPCDTSAECFANRPWCDPSTGFCADCNIDCMENSHCEVDASEAQECVCDISYVADSDGVCVLECSSNEECSGEDPICDSITGLCRDCEIGECLLESAPVCNEVEGTCWAPCAELSCESYLNNHCVVSFSGDSASCECVSGASPADITAEQGDCLYDNQCLNNADCTDATIPVCNDQGGCSNPCDITDCDTNETCILDDSFAPICDCSEGYFRSATSLCILDDTCVNNADCEEDVPLCDTSVCVSPCALASCAPQAECSAVGLVATCTCGPGYEGNGQVCSDIDGCAAAPCAANVNCFDVPAPSTGYTCGTCPEGFVGDGETCEPDLNDDCANNPCLNGGVCTDTGVLSYGCDCTGTGYEGDICQNDFDECLTNNGGCGSALYTSCTNNAGAAPTCTDIDECETNNGGCGNANYTTCANNNGAEPTCEDIDECATDNGGCGDATYTTCGNNIGAEPTCTDINECDTNNGGCGSAAYVTCSNNLNSAPSCSDINECESNNGGCGNAVYTSCGNNYGAAPTCTDINECDTNNGGCEVTCNDQIGGPPTCSCGFGEILDTDGVSCVECVSDSDCVGSEPVCNVVTNQCRGCVYDGDCSGNATLKYCQGYTGPGAGEGDMGNPGGNPGNDSSSNDKGGDIPDGPNTPGLPDDPIGGGFQYGTCVQCTIDSHCDYSQPAGYTDGCSSSYFCISVSVPCPANSSLSITNGNRTCSCNPFYYGAITWNFSSESWSGICIPDDIRLP